MRSQQNSMREVCVFVAGGSPQIITETLQALSRQQPPVYADELHIITTSEGRSIISKALYDERKLAACSEEIGMSAILPDHSSFTVPCDRFGRELADLKSTDDNEAMGEQIITFIRDLASRDGVRLHCSLAGGRKTMSYYLGVAMELFARPHDRLYHVLVSPEFENTAFFYQPRQNQIIEKKDGTWLNSDDAEIFLADLPFIRLRDRLARQGLAEYTFSALVREGQISLDTAALQPKVRASIREYRLNIGEIAVELSPTQMTLFIFFLKRKLSRCAHEQQPYCRDESGQICTDCFLNIDVLLEPDAVTEMIDDYAVIKTRLDTPKAHEQMARRDEQNPIREWLRHDPGMGHELHIRNLRSHIRKINKELEEQLNDPTLAAQFCILPAGGKWSRGGYGVRVDKKNIMVA